MKFKTFINEIKAPRWRDVDSFIKKNCKDYIKKTGYDLSINDPNYLSKGKNKILYRGMKKARGITVKKVRKDRKPVDTEIRMSKLINHAFHDLFGWYPRTEAMFAFGDSNYAEDFGNVFVVFPIGSFQFIYSPQVLDLSGSFIDNLMARISIDISDLFMEKFIQGAQVDSNEVREAIELTKKVMKEHNYTNKNLKRGIIAGVEIMIGCDSYLAIEEEWI